MKRLLLALLAGLSLVGLGLLIAGLAPSVSAQSVEGVYKVAEKLNCPLCQGQTLAECPLLICEQMREEIAQRLRQGQSEQEIIEAFVARYGIQVLNEPPAQGFNLLAWLMPLAGVIVILLLGAWVLKAWSQRQPATAEDLEVGLDELPDEYVRRLEEELEAFE